MGEWPTKIEPVLHVHGQPCPHDDVVIEGTAVALARLVNALRAAVTEGASKLDLFTNDGEGFTVRVVVMATDDETRKAATPYTHEAFECRGADNPWKRAVERTETA